MSKEIKHTILSILLAFLLLPFSRLYGQKPDEKGYGMYDRNIEMGRQTFRVQRIPKTDFFTLYDWHAPGCKVDSVAGFNRIRELLRDEFTFIYEEYKHPYGDSIWTTYILHEIRAKEGLRIFTPGEMEVDDAENEFIYFPEFHMLRFRIDLGAHFGVHLETGEPMDAPVSLSADRIYCLTGMHDGNEALRYKLKKWNGESQSYETFLVLDELGKHIPWEITGGLYYTFDHFWLKDTLYFRTTDKYFSVTLLH